VVLVQQIQSKIKNSSLKLLNFLVKEKDIELESKTSVLPIVPFRTKNGETICLNCYQITSIERNSRFKYTVKTQTQEWDVSRREFYRLLKLISK